MTRYKAISLGLGPIGLSIAQVALSRKSEIELIAAVDVDRNLQGKDLSELLQTGDKTGIVVSGSADDALREADVVLHATSSFLSVSKSQIIEFCQRGLDVVSTTEELSYPWLAHADEAKQIDACAKQNGVTVLGTGVNPGFVLDALAITLSGACISVSSVKGRRVLDALKRRVPFQRKVGIGLSRAQFEENVRTGKFGHIGLPESIAMVGAALDVEIERIEQNIVPKIAERSVATESFGLVQEGRVIGLVQDGVGWSAGNPVVSYHIEMYAGAENPADTLEITGNPNISLTIPGGTQGDSATAAIVINSVARVAESRPGLVTVKDLRPATSSFSSREA